jgi:transposase
MNAGDRRVGFVHIKGSFGLRVNHPKALECCSPSAGTVQKAATTATISSGVANTLMRSRSYLGAQYRRLRTKLGAPKAITAMAHRLARLVYRMLKYGQTYVDKGTEYYEERFRQQQIQLLRKRAAKLGLQVAEIHA